LERPVSQPKAGPSESELARLEEEISERLSTTAEIRPARTAKSAARPAHAPEPPLLSELTDAEILGFVHTRPWHLRHARKLITGGTLVVAGLVFFAYFGWRGQLQPPVPAAPLPVTKVPESPPASAAAPAPAAIPPPPVVPPPTRAAVPAPPAAPAPARATVPVSPAAPVATTARPVQTPSASRASPASAPVAAPSAGPRPPTVTHTAREPAPPAAAAAAAAAPVPATVAPPAAAPGDCPAAIAALDLCASHARKGGK
jgi:hypothetical protein